ncbi:MAG: formate acetyltransferase [Deltaproteobacteria bacterium]|nr:formate acetyltransferase [Deltaproteobacteria bacterium]
MFASYVNTVMLNAPLKLMAALYTHAPWLNRYLKSDLGWIDFTIGLKTESGSIEAAVVFDSGRVFVESKIPDDADVTIIFATDAAVKKLLSATPTEQLYMLLKSEFRTEGNFAFLQAFFFYISILLSKKQVRMLKADIRKDRKRLLKKSPCADPDLCDEMAKRRSERIRAEVADPNVRFLTDPYFSQYSLEDFPRLATFLDLHFTVKPAVCHELPKLVTDWYKKNGYETDRHGNPWFPALRQAGAYSCLLENKKPVIRKNDLIAGTTTTRDIGLVVYPEAHGTMIWSELKTVPHRALNPYDVSDETLKILHHEVFPFWTRRNFREWVREKYKSPLCQLIDERYAVYFIWKSVALSHTIPDFPKVLKLGVSGIIKEARQSLAEKAPESDQAKTLQAMILCLEGVTAYSKHLSEEAERLAGQTADPRRKMELIRLSVICDHVPEGPATTLAEAINSIWITWVCLHMENTNAGLSLGRLDQWLQPYFEADMARLRTESDRTAYIEHAIELVGCFYMRCTDHLPLTPDLANYLFGGSSSDQAITLGGVTPEGEDGVCDMTYIFLKVTEMLSIRDPNVNARFHPEKNTDAYLKRLCDVNRITAATPSLHNDIAVMESLAEFDYDIRDLRNWSATGCVEPTLSGKHIGHTNFMMMSMVAPLEMALNNGRHPLMKWDLGPKTGVVENGDFTTFDDFLKAYKTQFAFLVEKACAYNNMLGHAHAFIRPTPLLSSLIDGCIQKGRDVTGGGAKYNSSGAACIGLADVVDSLMAVKTLVFDEKKVTFEELKEAVDENFEKHPELYAMITGGKVPFFGSGSDKALKMANQLTRFVHDTYLAQPHYRGGKYTAGFWSMSNHVAYGTLSGALPSGKLAGKAFTPGLTPQASASSNLLDNIRDVARLDPHNVNNNMAFNVKVVPSANDTAEKIVANMFSYVKTYFMLGGMQMQMNVVTSEMLKDAMAHPENYRNLIVRISGYNAYFVTLNQDMQMELIERAEYGI